MRYIGSKKNVIPFIEDVVFNIIEDVEGKIFADLMSGTTVVSQFFKKKNSILITNDYMSFSYALQMAYINNSKYPRFTGLIGKYEFNDYNDIITYLNNLPGVKKFLYNEYTQEGTKNSKYQRNYFSEANAKKIDAIRIKLREWKKEKLITINEFYILLVSLIDAVTKVSNIAGTYGAFLKYDERRKHRPLTLKPINIIESNYNHKCYCEDIFNIIDKVRGDILYLDPPYNSRQYPPYYHILETVTLYDYPDIYGKTGRRPYDSKISPFCRKNEACKAINSVIEKANFKHIFLSYSTDGILTKRQIEGLLKKYGKTHVFEEGYRRYKSNNNGDKKKKLKELLYYVKKN